MVLCVVKKEKGGETQNTGMEVVDLNEASMTSNLNYLEVNYEIF